MWVVTRGLDLDYQHGCLVLYFVYSWSCVDNECLKVLPQTALTSFWYCWSCELRDSTLSLVVSSSSLVADATSFFSNTACWAFCNCSGKRIQCKQILTQKFNYKKTKQKGKKSTINLDTLMHHLKFCVIYLWSESLVHLIFVLLQLRLMILAELLHPLSQFTLKLSPSSRVHLHKTALMSASDLKDLLQNINTGKQLSAKVSAWDHTENPKLTLKSWVNLKEVKVCDL